MKKKAEQLKKLSLVTKITSIITLILIIPILIVCMFYFRVFQNSLLSDANNKLKENLNKMETAIDTNLDNIDAVINELYYRQEFSYFLDASNVLSKNEQNFYISSVQKELINIRYLYPNKFYYIAIYSSNNQFNKKYERQHNMDDLKEKPYYDEVINNLDKISFGQVRNTEFRTSNININNYNLDDLDTLVLPTYLKIYNLSTKKIIGVVEVDMEVTKLVGEENLHNLEVDSTYLLFNQNNHIVYQTGKFKDINFTNIDFNSQNGSTDIDIENRSYMMVYNQCSRTGLIRAVILSKENVLAFSNNVIMKVIIVALISMCIVVALIYWMIKKMLKRLLILDIMMAKIESGKFDVAIKDNGEDEISRISRSFNRMASQLNSVINSAIEKEQAQREAELRALQAQINPHFLYNTLENMRMQCEIDAYYTIGESLATLGELFRYSITWGSNEVPFDLEWMHLKNYISIMQMRFEDDVECILECEKDLGDVIVPKLMLQPLVENSFNHGFHDSLPPWAITIRAFKRNNALLITIEDNGSGIDEERLEKIKACMKGNTLIENPEKTRNSIGIINVKQRIDMICSVGSKMEINSQVGVGTKIVITIIMREE